MRSWMLTMSENPYEPPEHYVARRGDTIPWTAYLVVAIVLIAGATTTAIGFYALLPRTVIAGLFWLGLGLTGAYFIVQYRRKPNRPRDEA